MSITEYAWNITMTAMFITEVFWAIGIGVGAVALIAIIHEIFSKQRK